MTALPLLSEAVENLARQKRFNDAYNLLRECEHGITAIENLALRARCQPQVPTPPTMDPDEREVFAEVKTERAVSRAARTYRSLLNDWKAARPTARSVADALVAERDFEAAQADVLRVALARVDEGAA